MTGIAGFPIQQLAHEPGCTLFGWVVAILKACPLDAVFQAVFLVLALPRSKMLAASKSSRRGAQLHGEMILLPFLPLPETDDGSSKFIKPVDQDQLVHRLRGSSTFPFDLLGSKSFSRTLRRLSSLIQGTFRSSSIFSKYCNARFFLRQSDLTWCCA